MSAGGQVPVTFRSKSISFLLNFQDVSNFSDKELSTKYSLILGGLKLKNNHGTIANIIFFFLTDTLEEPEFQKAHECGNTSYTYNFYIKLMRLLMILVSAIASYSPSIVSSRANFLLSLFDF